MVTSKKTLIEEIEKMNEFHSVKEILKDFISKGLNLKSGRIRTESEYLAFFSSKENAYPKSRVDRLVAKAKEIAPSQVFKDISLVHAMAFLYPAEVIRAIQNMKVEGENHYDK